MRSRSSIVSFDKENQRKGLSNKILFIAYPNEPAIIGSTISTFVEKSRRYAPGRSITAWPELDVPGHFISSEVLDSISTTDILIADVSVLNFNVTYEIAYAIGRKKRLLLIRQESIEGGLTEVKELGVFDTIGWTTYANSDDLLSILSKDLPSNPIAFNNEQIRKKTPIYYLDAQFKTDPIVLLKSRLRKTKIPFVSFDPQETRRLSGYEVVFDVAGSTGVIVPLITQLEKESRLHNLRAAFVAGLGAGMEKEVLILQLGDDPVPIDYRDFVTMAKYPDQIIGALAEFAPRITDTLFTGVETARTSGDSILKKIQLGATRAENEDRDLRAYYVETNAFVRTQRGDIRLVLGRKGSGKTALLMQLRDRLLENRDNVVVDLMPEGYQFVKFREDVLRYMQEGTYEHTIIAFWEYALLLEVTYKILETDKALHLTNHNLFKPYQQLRKVYRADEYDREGDFSEHVGKLMDSFRQNFLNRYKNQANISLSTSELTTLLYEHDLSQLRAHLREYLRHKESVWLLIDKIDNGWPTNGLKKEDVLLIRTLVEGARKVERQLSSKDLECHSVIMLRNDVYELLVDLTRDRGKDDKVLLDWTDQESLRELLRRRIITNELPGEASFDELWHMISVSHVRGEESFQFILDRCLMRPRELLRAVIAAIGVGFERGHSRLEEDDIIEGLRKHSRELVNEISYEVRDVEGKISDVIYMFQNHGRKTITGNELFRLCINSGFQDNQWEEITRLLLWYGVLGIAAPGTEARYIYSVSYDMKLLQAPIMRKAMDEVIFEINPAFWLGLEIE